MKKTEKIELRVDPDEKERLSGIAERRGQTVSDVVRDALSAELGLPKADYPKWPGWVALTAVCFAAASIVLSLTSRPTDYSDFVAYPTSIAVQTEWVGGNRTSFALPIDIESRREFELTGEDGDTVRILISTEKHEASLMNINVDACRPLSTGCETLPIPNVSIDTRPSRSSTANTSIRLDEFDFITVRFTANTYWPEPT